jgi:hypothetical protein
MNHQQALERNPLLEPPVDDPTFVDRPDGVVNHDFYVYGGLPKYVLTADGWIALPVLD